MDRRKKLTYKFSSTSSTPTEDEFQSKLFANLSALHQKRRQEEKRQYKEAIDKYRESRNSYMDSQMRSVRERFANKD